LFFSVSPAPIPLPFLANVAAALQSAGVASILSSTTNMMPNDLADNRFFA
jgi:hypothetical protein